MCIAHRIGHHRLLAKMVKPLVPGPLSGERPVPALIATLNPSRIGPLTIRRVRPARSGAIGNINPAHQAGMDSVRPVELDPLPIDEIVGLVSIGSGRLFGRAPCGGNTQG